MPGFVWRKAVPGVPPPASAFIVRGEEMGGQLGYAFRDRSSESMVPVNHEFAGVRPE